MRIPLFARSLGLSPANLQMVVAGVDGIRENLYLIDFNTFANLPMFQSKVLNLLAEQIVSNIQIEGCVCYQIKSNKQKYSHSRYKSQQFASVAASHEVL